MYTAEWRKEALQNNAPSMITSPFGMKNEKGKENMYREQNGYIYTSREEKKRVKSQGRVKNVKRARERCGRGRSVHNVFHLVAGGLEGLEEPLHTGRDPA